MAARYGFGTGTGTLTELSPRIKRLGKRVVDTGRLNMGPAVKKRGIRSASKGLMIFGGPLKKAWADTIEVDGVQYTAEAAQ
ncbi:MAG: hypothetical protein Q9196_007467, partial [Gyalolechia fulgens]